MKWNMVLGVLALSLSLSSQSYGFELLDRMLGIGGGCCQTSCCEKPCGPVCEPSCGAAAAACAPACEPACGYESACAPACRKSRCRKGSLSDLFARKKKCCPSACDTGCDTGCDSYAAACEPACGCDAAACAPACPKQRCCRRMGLLDLFRCKRSCRKSACGASCAPTCGYAAAGEPSCGCSYGAPSHNGGPAPHVEGEAAPMPPAPMADPAAMVPNRGNVVKAASLYR